MGMNLRLSDPLAASLRDLSTQTGKSQQALIREAIEMYVRDYRLQAYPPEIRHAITPASRLLSEILSELPPPTGWSGDKSVVETIREDRDSRG